MGDFSNREGLGRRAASALLQEAGGMEMQRRGTRDASASLGLIAKSGFKVAAAWCFGPTVDRFPVLFFRSIP